MTAEAITILSSLALGVGLAAAAGLRIFVPLLIAGLSVRFGWFDPTETTQTWLGSTGALITFGVATIVEVLAYKLPVVDNALDVIGAPAAAIAGIVLTSAFLVGIDDPWLKGVLSIIMGATAAGTVHASTAAARLVSTKFTAGIGNPAVSLAELAGAIITSIMAFVWPFLVAFVLVATLFIGWWLLRRRRARLSPTV